MKLVIGHLYYDLMNLYGDNGNIKALEYHLKKQNVNVEVKKLSINDKINFKELDLIYIGSGTEENAKIVLKDLLQYKNDILKCYKNNTFFLITGNAIEFFGKSIIDKNKNCYEGLNLFKYYAKHEKTRIVKEVCLPCSFLKDNLLGFMNHQGNIYSKNSKMIPYGIYKNNFYGTYIIGPILVRNPEFLQLIVTKLINKKSKKVKVKPFNTRLDEEAYLDFIAFKNS